MQGIWEGYQSPWQRYNGNDNNKNILLIHKDICVCSIHACKKRNIILPYVSLPLKTNKQTKQGAIPKTPEIEKGGLKKTTTTTK